MKKQKYYWKLVRVGRKYFDIFYSSNESIRPPLLYKIGQTTKPEVGKLFVFETRRHARNFKKSLGFTKIKYKILRVEITGSPVRASKVIDPFYLSFTNLKLFWEHDMPFITMNAPEGTMLVDSVTPIEIVS